MHLPVSLRITGVLLLLFSTAILPPMVLGLLDNDGSAHAFATAFAINIVAGLALWLPTREARRDLRIRDGFDRRP